MSTILYMKGGEYKCVTNLTSAQRPTVPNSALLNKSGNATALPVIIPAWNQAKTRKRLGDSGMRAIRNGGSGIGASASLFY